MYFSDCFEVRGLKNVDFSEIASVFLRESVRDLLKPQMLHSVHPERIIFACSAS